MRLVILRHILLFAVLSFIPKALAEQPAPHSTFAVIVGNNQSLDGSRAELNYADDDAAKYFDIFEGVTTASPHLLARFDHDSERLYPQAHSAAKPPTRAELLRAGKEIAEQVRALAADGGTADVYFVYAGHGDVEQGRGYIELADARFTAADLEHWLKAIPFARAHVILDSCNSFFMLATRKPGGRYYATSQDAARSLAERLPNVGVFLSTSAEADAFEWSELQSGVFSHIVRSGLLGAADANADGAIDYDELGAFVATATADVSNPNMRPHVFARGPNGKDSSPIVTLGSRSNVRSVHVAPSVASRSRLRDAAGIPLLDMHPEAELPVTLAVPERWAAGATLERAKPHEAPVVQALEAIDAEPHEAKALLAARGPAQVFEQLFSEPYGPAAVTTYRVQLHDDKPHVFGVSRETASRMSLMLDEVKDAGRDNRRYNAVTLMVIGASFATGAGFGLERAYRTPVMGTDRDATLEWAGLAGSATMIGFGMWSLFQQSDAELLADEYRTALKETGDHARAFAMADDKLHKMASRDNTLRWVNGITAGVTTLVGAGLITLSAVLPDISDSDRQLGITVGGAVGVVGGMWLASNLFIQTPIQRLTTLWHRDPGAWQLQPSIGPQHASLTLSGKF